ncbi:MAG: helix-turn-helix domain-containing protein [Phycisphaerales bacterium]|nr:helix-turn-helix domain-containing protein [Phycisphaerales bacterium]
MQQGDDRVLLRVGEAARLLALSERATWRLIAERELRVIKLGRATRVPRSELDRIARDGLAKGGAR